MPLIATAGAVGIVVCLLAVAIVGGSTARTPGPTGSFSPTGSMTAARSGHTSTLLSDGRVLIAGGSDFRVIAEGSASPGYVLSGNVLASAELYDRKTGTFSPTGSMTTARVGQTATLLSDGRVLIAGGTGTSDTLSSAELYQP